MFMCAMMMTLSCQATANTIYTTRNIPLIHPPTPCYITAAIKKAIKIWSLFLYAVLVLRILDVNRMKGKNGIGESNKLTIVTPNRKSQACEQWNFYSQRVYRSEATVCQ